MQSYHIARNGSREPVVVDRRRRRRMPVTIPLVHKFYPQKTTSRRSFAHPIHVDVDGYVNSSIRKDSVSVFRLSFRIAAEIDGLVSHSAIATKRNPWVAHIAIAIALAWPCDRAHICVYYIHALYTYVVLVYEVLARPSTYTPYIPSNQKCLRVIRKAPVLTDILLAWYCSTWICSFGDSFE